MSYFKWDKALFAFIFALSVPNVEAALITYEFSGNGTSMFVHDGETGVNTFVSSSSQFGIELTSDSEFSASFTYDTLAIEGSYRQNYPSNNTAIYGAGLVGYDVSIGNFGYSFSPFGSIQIWDNRSGTDSFSISASEFANSELFLGSGFYVFDNTASSQVGFLIPETLAVISTLGSEHFKFYWLDKNSGDQLHFSGSVTTLKSVTVPESDSLFFLALGFLLLFIWRKDSTTANGVTCLAGDNP